MSTTPTITDERRGLPSASNIHRLAACPGSHRLCAGIPDRSTSDSTFGTNIHEYLAGKRKLEDLTPEEEDIALSCEKIEAKVVKEWKARLSLEEFEIEVSRDIERLWLEVYGVPRCSGVADVIYAARHHALVIDFKTLPGDHADSQDNLQLRCLTVLTNRRHDYKLESVDVAIIQPLVTHSPTVCRYDQAAIHLATVELVGILDAAQEPNAPLVTGDHCKFCRASSICPEVHKEVTTMGALTINEAGLTVSDQDMAALRAKCGAAKKMIASIEAECFRRAEADPAAWKALGWEIQQGSGKRKVTNVGEVANRIEAAGASMNDIAAKCSVSIKAVNELVRAATGLKGAGLAKTVDTILDGCTAITTPKPSLKRIGNGGDDEESADNE